MRFEKLVFLAVLGMALLGMAGSGVQARMQEPAPASPLAEAGRRLYRRDPSRPVGEPAAGQVEIVFTGDVMLGRQVSGQPGVFAGVAGALSAADLAVGNLEGVLADSSVDPAALSQSAHTGYRLDWPAGMAAGLQTAGFDLLSVANNHAWDRGLLGVSETASALQRLGITRVGRRPGEAVYRMVNGVRLAFLGVNDVPVPGRPDARQPVQAVEAAVQQAAQNADVVVVLVHWGDEYSLRATPRQAELARRLAAAGADLLVGSHPHVLQGSEVLARRDGQHAFVAYSLGNFVFDQGEAETRQGAVLWVTVDRRGVSSVRAQPVSTYLRAQWSDDLGSVERMVPAGERLAYACSPQTCVETDAPKPAGNGRFFQGGIDLTGDGAAEWVTNTGERVSFLQNEQTVWQSPPEWRIYDVALGDPNDDGRYEAVVAFEKVDRRGKMAGKVASHPFLIGYRGGRYGEVWGGSAVADRILEVEVGDVDGDGRDNLVALEQRCDNAGDCDWAAVTVWQWNGWGFSLLWRSPAERLSKLSLCKGDNETQWICVEKGW